MKVTLRLPTKDPYAYVELETETEGYAEAVQLYEDAIKVVKGEPVNEFGISEKYFNEALDRYLWGDLSMDATTYDSMGEDQKRIIQAIKRSRKRNNYESTKK